MNTFYQSLFDRTIVALEQLRGVAQVPGAYLDFRLGLCHAQWDACCTLGPIAVPLPLRTGVLSYDVDILMRVPEQTAESPGVLEETSSELRKYAGHLSTFPGTVDEALFRGDNGTPKDLLKDIGMPEEALQFFGRACGAPYVFRAVRSEAADSLVISQESTNCPFCGSAPSLSVLRGDPSRRLLVCSLCSRSWEFPRMACPFCLHRGTLETLSDQSAPDRKIEACDHCGHYLKVIDRLRTKDAGEVLPLAESVELLYLDIIAEKEGYARGVPHVAPL